MILIENGRLMSKERTFKAHLSVDAQGKTIVDHACEDHDICPDCRGPLDQRRVYGLLS